MSENGTGGRPMVRPSFTLYLLDVVECRFKDIAPGAPGPQEVEFSMKKFLLASVTIASFFTGASAAQADLRIVFDRVINMNRNPNDCANFNQNLIEDPGKKIVCMVSGSGGHFQGAGERGSVSRDNTNTWVFTGGSCQPGVFFHITCIEN
jgi:hypothetical protein